MERIKLAILKAKEGANQRQLEQPQAAVGSSPPLTGAEMAGSPDPWANHARRHAKPKRRSWGLAVPLLLGLASVIGFWAVKSDPGTAPLTAAMQAEPAPAPKVVVTPVQPVEPTLLADTHNAIPASPASAAVPARAAGTAAGTTERDHPPLPLNDEVVAAVEAWRQAWSTRDMLTYLGSYSDAFTPPDGMSRDDWIASRYRNVGGRTSIDVRVQRLLVLTRGEGRARVSFLQDYTSGNFRELRQPKTLDLVRDVDSRWRIVGEWLGDPPPAAAASKS